jgi:hypothetical protein
MTRERLLAALEETLGAPSPVRSSAAWKGTYAPAAVVPPSSPPFPYRTETAEVVWKYVRDLIPKHPEMDEQTVLKRAIELSGVDPLDLSPEDWRLLEMAIEWRKAGATWQKRPRIGGAPGGPYDSWDMGHYLPKRGAP